MSSTTSSWEPALTLAPRANSSYTISKLVKSLDIVRGEYRPTSSRGAIRTVVLGSVPLRQPYASRNSGMIKSACVSGSMHVSCANV